MLIAAGSVSAQEVINENGDFEQSTAGQTSGISNWQLLLNEGATAEVVQDPNDEENLLLRVELTDTSVAANPWDIQVRHYADPELELEEGHEHQISFRVRAENPTEATVQLDGGAGAQLWGQAISGEEWTTLETGTFTAESGETRVMAIHLAADTNPNGQVIFVDDLEVVDLDAGTPAPEGVWSFEDGTLGAWYLNTDVDNGYSTSGGVTDTMAAEGTYSVEVTAGADAANSALVYDGPEGVAGGDTLSFQVYVPADALPDISAVQPFVQYNEWAGWADSWNGSDALVADAWNTVEVIVPQDAETIQRVGVQVVGASAEVTPTVYVDHIVVGEYIEPPSPPAGDVVWSFEDEMLDPWYFLDDDNYTSSGSVTDTMAFAGSYSVELNSGTDAADAAFVYDSPAEIAPGDTVRYHVYVPADALPAINGLQPFVQYNDWAGWADTWNGSGDLEADAWNTLAVVVPQDAENFQRMGIQITGTDAASTATIYVDNIAVDEFVEEEPPPPPPPPSGNLVTNGSFEQTAPGIIEDLTSGLEGWVLETSVDPVFEVVDDVAHDDSQALAVTVNEVGSDPWSIQAVADSIEVEPGATYSYSVWARTESGEGTAAFTVGNYDFSEYLALRDDITITDEWQEFTGEFTITDEETFIRAPIHFSYAANAGQAIYIDNLQITDPGAGLQPVLVEAESGEVGDELETLTDEETGTTFITTTTGHDETTGTGEYPGENRTASYEVTFPHQGMWELYARVRVGADGFDDDSFFYGSGFGEKDPAAADDWTMVNQLAEAGYTEPDDYIEAVGTAGSEVWKWVNLSENQLTGELPDTFVVEEGSLTHTFEIGAREDGLDIDKFVFGPADVYFTVANLNNGEAGVREIPSDTIPEPTGPPLAAGLDKWLGNIYSPTQTEHFEHYWNQVTPENAGKWGSVEGTRDEMNWGPLDEAYALAQDNGFPFRFHVLVWGNQQPDWISDLSVEEQQAEIREWFEAVAERYPDIDYLEVVNEPLPGHNPPDGGNGRADYIEALGGGGDTGWDWVITAFEMAREIFPEETQLMINDYGILSNMNAAGQYRDLIELLQDRDLIDAIGMQGHAFSTRAGAPLQDVLDHLAETGLPIQITEMDVDGNPNATDISQEESDQNQLQAMQRIFPTLWEHPAVEGITMWGWRPGLWRTEQEAYLVRDNGAERPALVWLREYLDAYGSPTEEVADVPQRFHLAGNYPNPFNPSTQIRYDIADAVDVTLKVYDLLGREVATLVDARKVPGEYTVTFDAQNAASGVYLYRLQAGSYVETKQMVLVK